MHMSVKKQKRSALLTLGTICCLLFTFLTAFHSEIPKTLAIGSKAPDFKLKGTDGKNYTLQSFSQAKILVIIFTCNHCPTAQAYEERIKKLTGDYENLGVSVVAIMPNYAAALRYDELGWSDEPDDYEGMKARAKDKAFNFPYLYDGDTEEVSLKYGPVSTPHVFIFDQERILRYAGRIDDEENFRKPVHSQDTRNAIDALLANKPVPVETTKVFGCSVKWKSKSEWISNSKARWSKQPVSLKNIDAQGIGTLLRNEGTDKLKMFYFWSTACTACDSGFPDYIKLSRIYQERDFEFVSICIDDPGNATRALDFLKAQQSAGDNWLYPKENADSILTSQGWDKKLPYTVLVEPGGKIVFSKQGAVDAEALRRMIFNDPFIGRLFK